MFSDFVNYCHSQFRTLSLPQKKPCTIISCNVLQPKATTNYSLLIDLPIVNINGITQYVVFCNQLLSLSIMLFKLSVLYHISILHFYCLIILVYGQTSFCPSIHHLMDSWVLAIMNNASVNICILVFAQTYVFDSLGYIPRIGIAGQYGNDMFKLLRNWQTPFQSSCPTLHSHKQRIRVPLSPHPHQRLLPSDFLVTVLLVDVKWHLVVWVCIPLMTNCVD